MEIRMSLKINSGLGMLAAVLLLGACDAVVYNIPTEVNQERAEVYRDQVDFEVKTSALGAGHIQNMAKEYWRYGQSPMHVTVTYDPESRANTARNASEQAARIAGALRQQGVKSLDVDTMPVRGLGEESTTLVSYGRLKARAPKGCDATLDMDFVTFEQMDDYKLGCSIESHLAKQVARPKDLLGEDAMDSAEGRYSANNLETYMSGKPNEPLQVETTSGE